MQKAGPIRGFDKRFIFTFFSFFFRQATIIIFIGAHLSIPGKQINQETGETEVHTHTNTHTQDKSSLEQMIPKDVMMM
jgi:hypothetical protein